MTNSVDPDQLASSEANWSGFTLFAKAGYIRVQQDKGNSLDLAIKIQTNQACVLATDGGKGVLVFLLFLHFHLLFPYPQLFLFFLSSTSSSIHFLSFSGKQYKMSHKGWHVV